MSTRPYRPPLRKRLLAKAPVRFVLTFLAACIIRMVFLLSHRKTRISTTLLPFARGESQAIYCFWHGRILFMPFLKPRGRRISALISRHGDGAVIASMLARFGIGTVRGSSSRGGATALRELLALTAAGHNIAITPDGPRGPHQVAAAGAIWLAAQSGLPVIPVSGTSTRRKHAKSWDAFTLPLPFGRIICEVGEPMYIPANSNDSMVETFRLALEQQLRTLTTSLDAAADAPHTEAA